MSHFGALARRRDARALCWLAVMAASACRSSYDLSLGILPARGTTHDGAMDAALAARACADAGTCADAAARCDGSACECSLDRDCGSGAVCDVAAVRCRARCSSDDDCKSSAPLTTCHPSAHFCIQCMSDSDCQEQPAAPHCEPLTHACAACTGDQDCSDQHRCVLGACQ